MRVILTIHGGAQGLMDVMEGLVERNVRSIHERHAPPTPPGRVTAVPFPIWRDSVTALADGVASTGTLAAWKAAADRVHGAPARIAMVGGVPSVVHVTESGGLRLISTQRKAGSGVRDRYDPQTPTEGRITEHMLLTLDDDQALPVQEINTAIARHNAGRIKLHGLPRLYSSGVRYEHEGTPELWWDAEEILRNGHDDCEGLAAYRAGELINENLDARVITRLIVSPRKKGGGRLFHAVTGVYDVAGRLAGVDDPSARLGMRVPAFYLDYARKRRAQGLQL